MTRLLKQLVLADVVITEAEVDTSLGVLVSGMVSSSLSLESLSIHGSLFPLLHLTTPTLK